MYTKPCVYLDFPPPWVHFTLCSMGVGGEWGVVVDKGLVESSNFTKFWIQKS